MESMIQRVVRQIQSANVADEIVVATGISQKDAIENQVGEALSIVTEPCRRDTFPAILLASSFLASNGVDMNEPVVVMPCDSFTDDSYFSVIGRMGEAVANGVADLVLMGIEPTYPSSKFGYIVPEGDVLADGARMVKRFTEKPDVPTAEKLLEEGALWNGGVFAFRLGYLMDIASKTVENTNFKELRDGYADLTKISFDYAVVEKAKSIAVLPYSGVWKDLGTWNTLTEELPTAVFGNGVAKDSEGSYIVNELEVPVVCIGAKNMIVAASPDGILVSDRDMSEGLKALADGVAKRPMYEERRWGTVKIIDCHDYPDGVSVMTKEVTVKPGCEISYHLHARRDEVWTILHGEGEVAVNGKIESIKSGDVVRIPKGTHHGIRAITPLSFIEIQHGSVLSEEDIERFPSKF